MKFVNTKNLTKIEQLALKNSAKLSGTEYGAMSYMNLTEEEMELIFHYEKVKWEILERRREEDKRRRFKVEKERFGDEINYK